MYLDVSADSISRNVAAAQCAVVSRLQPARKCCPARKRGAYPLSAFNLHLIRRRSSAVLCRYMGVHRLSRQSAIISRTRCPSAGSLCVFFYFHPVLPHRRGTSRLICDWERKLPLA